MHIKVIYLCFFFPFFSPQILLYKTIWLHVSMCQVLSKMKVRIFLLMKHKAKQSEVQWKLNSGKDLAPEEFGWGAQTWFFCWYFQMYSAEHKKENSQNITEIKLGWTVCMGNSLQHYFLLNILTRVCFGFKLQKLCVVSPRKTLFWIIWKVDLLGLNQKANTRKQQSGEAELMCSSSRCLAAFALLLLLCWC